jgi:hypothetical protein
MLSESTSPKLYRHATPFPLIVPSRYDAKLIMKSMLIRSRLAVVVKREATG